MMLSKAKGEKQERKGRSRSAPRAYSNVMMVRIRKDDRGEPEGEIIHLNLRKPVPYQGMADLGFRIDEIARFLNLPDSGRRGHIRSAVSAGRKVDADDRKEISDSGKETVDRETVIADRKKEESSGNIQGYRSWGREQKEEQRALQEEFFQAVPTEQWKREDFAGRFPTEGAKETVSVELLGRQYMSLQGRLRCRGTREQYVYFRSALELMHFFAELLQDRESRGHPSDDEVPNRMEEQKIR